VKGRFEGVMGSLHELRKVSKKPVKTHRSRRLLPLIRWVRFAVCGWPSRVNRGQSHLS
jgi:hypothetical protein